MRSTAMAMLARRGALLLLALCGAAAGAGCWADEAGRAARLAQAVSSLTAAGYTVEPGIISFAQTCSPDARTCYGNNPTTPYGRYMLRTPPSEQEQGIYQLGPREAIVFFGCTPPRARYYGLQSYVFESGGTILFASMGDAINFRTVNVSGSDPFDQEWLVTTTNDQNAAAAVFDMFARHAGVARAAMNVDVIPDAAALGIDPVGYGRGKSIFGTLFRIALCDNQTACTAYENRNWTVLRVRPPGTSPALPYPLQPLRPRPTDVTEGDLATALQTLATRVQTGALRPTSRLVDTARIYSLLIEGRTCIRLGLNCMGDTRDTVYMNVARPPSPARPTYLLPDTADDYIVVVGVLHSRTSAPSGPLATYTNVAVYYDDKKMGVLGVVDTQLAGSAAAYGGAPYLYVAKFARHCHGENFCFEVPTAFPGVPIGSNLTLVERAYVNPATKVGPDGTALQAPYILHFAPRV